MIEATGEDAFSRPVRRVVTGHDETGRSIIVSDGQTTTHHASGGSGMTIYDLWETFEAPAPMTAMEDDPTAVPLHFGIPTIGVRIRIAEIPPAGERAPFMHRTESIDTILVLRGEMTMLIDDAEVVLRAGDTLVQRGTDHAWVNRSGAPCRILFIIIGGRMTEALKQTLGIETFEWDPRDGGTGHRANEQAGGAGG